MEDIIITLADPNDIGTEKFANIVDPVLLSIFIERLQDPNEKRSLDELVQALLEGRF